MGKTKGDILSGVNQVVVRSKFVDNNTVEYFTPDNRRVIRLHDTDILVFLPDGSYSVDTGGWRTVTTKDRINKFSRYRVWSDRGTWKTTDATGNEYVFFDGIRYTPEGKVQNSAGSGKEEKRIKILKKKIDNYCVELKKLDVFPEPSAGDCWFCSMFERGGMGSQDHLEEHLNETYIHGSLIYNAMKDAGYRDEGIALMTGWGSAKGKPFAKDNVHRAVRRYFKRRLAIA